MICRAFSAWLYIGFLKDQGISTATLTPSVESVHLFLQSMKRSDVALEVKAWLHLMPAPGFQSGSPAVIVKCHTRKKKRFPAVCATILQTKSPA